jgi:hypothetical protein
MSSEKYSRVCPKCNKKMCYIFKQSLNRAIKNNSLCSSCATIKNNSNEEYRKKLAAGYVKRSFNEEYKQKQIDALKKRYSDPMEIEKLSIAQKKRFENKKEIEKLSIAQKERYLDIKEKQKSSIAQRKYWKIHPEEKKKRSILTKKALHSPEIRKRHIKALVETKYLGKSVDKGQLELLDKWKLLGFNFQPNYQIHTDDFLCYLDGYDKEKNVVLEYDTKYHSSIGQKEKDLVRQQKIIDILKPKKFWRYDAVNKQFKNVLERKKEII